MQTFFTPQQLADPRLAEANKILRACVHCGICTATCPSYQVLGDELDSPRGRIYLMKEMLESGRAADAKTALHIDRCLSCLACTSTCPSGVDYMHLIDTARVHVEKTYARPWFDRLLRAVLARVIPYPTRFRLMLRAAQMVRPLARFWPDPRLRAMLDLAPQNVPPPSRADRPQTFAALGPRKYRVALLTGCAQQVLNTDINTATIRLLRKMGCDVVSARGAGCCGALTHHMGKEDLAHRSARATITAWMAEHQRAPLDAIIINTSGCGTTIKDYGHMFARSDLAQDAATIAALAKDVCEFLASMDLPVLPAQDMRIAYHAACSLQHGQQIKSAPKDLLRAAGFEVTEPRDSHLCCGSAGTYNLLQPEISAQLQARKVAHLLATAPQMIAAGNIGCMMQIGAKAGLPVVHTIELLDWAYGGPMPRAWAARQ